MTTVNFTLSESLERMTLIWVGVSILLIVGSLFTYQPLSHFLDPVILISATGIAFILTTAQAYQNGNLVLSWLLTSSPGIAFSVHQYKPIATGYVFPLSFLDILHVLTIGLFCGTTAHLLGKTLAEFHGFTSQQLSKMERRGLPLILVLTGVLFVYFFVAPYFL